MIIDPDRADVKIVKTDENYSIIRIPNTDVHRYWTGVEVELDKDPTLWNFGQTKESILNELMCGNVQLWFVLHHKRHVMGVFFTTTSRFPATDTFDIVWASGHKMPEYLGLLLAAVEAFAGEHDINRVTVTGRLGWSKFLAPYGYAHMQSVFARTITKGYH